MKLTVLAAILIVLSTSLAHAADPDVTPHAADTGTRTFPVLRVEITDADVAPILVSPVTDAMTDPVNRIRRLHLLFQVAKKTNHTLVVTHGVRAFVVPRAENGFLPLDGDALSPPLRQQVALNIPRASSLFPPAGTHADKARYRLHQVVHLAGRINPDGTATVQYEIAEVPKTMPGMTGYTGRVKPTAARKQSSTGRTTSPSKGRPFTPAGRLLHPLPPGLTVEVTDTHDFHSGDTLAVPIPTFGPGIQHRVYISVTILPPAR